MFVLLAPVSLPVYALVLAAGNLLGAAYYLVVEASLSRIARRPIALTRGRLILFALPVLLLAPVAMAIHMALWLVRLIGRLLCALGRWQTATASKNVSFVVGLIWMLVASWTTLTCLNAALGLRQIGIPLQGRDVFVHGLTRYLTLGEMPNDVQDRRRAMLAEIRRLQKAVGPDWEILIDILKDDDAPFRLVAARRPLVAKKLTGLPWFFQPGEVSADGLDHSQLLLGPLLFIWLLLLRWPAVTSLLRFAALRHAFFGLRLAAAVVAVYALVTWLPVTSKTGFVFASGSPSGLFRFASPAVWLGISPDNWARPEWALFNAACWLILAGVAVFIWWLAWRISPFLAWPRYYIAFLASRLLQRKRIAFFSVGAVTLCVAMMIIVISVMGGFVDSIRNRAHGLLGDLVMDGDLQGFPYYQRFIDKISSLRDESTGELIVVQATPLIYTYGLLQFPETRKTKAVRIWGIRLDEYVRVNEFGENLFYRKRYGGTTLRPQAQPVWGSDDQLIATLPPELEAHYRSYVASLEPAERAQHEKRYQREPLHGFPGPGRFEPAAGESPRPGYEGRSFPGVIIGRDIIAHRMPSGEYRRSPDYPRGVQCILTMLPLTRSGAVSPEPPPKPSFRYVDDSRTGIHEIDSMNVYIDFDELQRLLSMGPQERVDDSGRTLGTTGARCSQIQIKVHSRFGSSREELLKIKARIAAAWEEFRLTEAPAIDDTERRMMSHVETDTWEEMQKSYISAIEKEKFLVLIMFGVISIVAVFLILCIFYMIVQEKTRDIGIIKSIGAGSEGVTAVFLAYGAAIGLVGCVFGSLLGTEFVEHINEIQDWLARLNPGWRVWSPETYSFDKIPDIWKWSEVIWISFLAILASVAGAAFPAMRAGRTWPVESLRYE
ncbi:MAG: ABC transporter permease [Phycisphaerae bacterium]